MKIIVSESTNPYFNLAMEEYLLKSKEEDFFILWQNEKSIIIGKNQNTYAEINNSYVVNNGIKVVRRITGGGAVFHDLGNINYTYIKRNSKELFNNYKEFCELIIKYLKKFGINAELSGRNDMLIDNKKFSGNAQCAYGNSVMHHGTLLFSSEMEDLSNALNVNPLKIQSKGIKSVKSRVTNISDHIDASINVAAFINGLKEFVMENITSSSSYVFSKDDVFNINELVRNKYGTKDWNYGFKQEYTVKSERKFESGLIQCFVKVNNNQICSIKIYGDFFGLRDISDLENRLIGITYEIEAIRNALIGINLEEYISGIKHDELIDLILV